MRKVLIIAEAGVNHNGSIENAKKLVDVAAEAGADIIKFQSFITDKIVTSTAQKANYQKQTTDQNESQYEMIKKLELSFSQQNQILEYCKVKKIQFLSTPFDIESAQFLFDLGLDIFKIPSGEITNLPYLRKISSFGKNIILSTGMADMFEIEEAIKILTSGNVSRDQITVLHCHTEYPTLIENVNLKAMITIKDKLNVRIGYSDHTEGIEVPIAAAALGATIIEKHFTLDKNMPGPDHKASLSPHELRLMVSGIRNIEKAIGDGVKKPTETEMNNRKVARKSIVALTKISIGETFTSQNITVKRPGTGISPMKWDEIIGTRSKYNFEADELIK